MTAKSMLIIGDPHVDPEYSNDRFDWLGRYIADTRPDIVLCMGDFNNVGSLSRFDRGKVTFEGRRYAKDIEHNDDALARIDRPSVRTKYRPRKVMVKGNHEHRIEKHVAENPELVGKIGYKDLGFENYGWETSEFLETLNIQGFAVAHYFQSGNTDKAISGINAARSLIQKGHESTIVGHSHLLGTATDTTSFGRKLHGISAGCFTHPNFVESWSIQSAKLAWRGVIRLDGAERGDYLGLTLVTQESLRKAYGGKR